MNKARIIKKGLAVLLPAGLLLASYTLNWARFELGSDDYTDRSVISDRLPENISRIGLQMAYSSAGEKESLRLLESLAVELEKAGAGQVLILPALIDLDAAGENLDGIFLVTLDLNRSGWQLGRRGTASVTAHFVPLRKMAILSLRTGTASAGSARGWLSRAYFSERLLDFTAQRTSRLIAAGFDLPGFPAAGEPVPAHVENNLTELPLALAVMLPPDTRVLSVAFQGSSFMFTFSTSMDAADLEPLLTGNLVHELNLEITMDWASAAGARRKAAYLAADRGLQVEAYYSYAGDFGDPRDYGSPRRPPADEPKIVTIIQKVSH